MELLRLQQWNDTNRLSCIISGMESSLGARPGLLHLSHQERVGIEQHQAILPLTCGARSDHPCQDFRGNYIHDIRNLDCKLMLREDSEVCEFVGII